LFAPQFYRPIQIYYQCPRLRSFGGRLPKSVLEHAGLKPKQIY
jgi:hypothetical protein